MIQKKDKFAVILVGGSGTRFWPKSRAAVPKQFLSLVGKQSLFVQTLHRLKTEIPKENIIVTTNKAYKTQVAKDLKSVGIPVKNILCEPSAKNTAPAILWAAAHIHHRNKNAFMAVFPSDHLIVQKANFMATLKSAFVVAQANRLVTLGIVPTRPETGYGYIKMSKRKIQGTAGFDVDRFVEKPQLAKAKEYLRKKVYLWNSGMFVWRTEIILDAFKKHQPVLFSLMADKCGEAHIKRVWKKVPSVSIDYGVLEVADNVATVPAKNIGWSDLGSWESMTEVMPKDAQGNILKGDVCALSSRDSFVWGETRFVATIGLDNVIVVDTKEALLICRKDLSQDVREVVAMLKKGKRKII